VKNSNADALYFVPNPDDTINMLKQIKKIRLNIPLLSADTMTQYIKGSDSKLLEGIVYSTPLFSEGDSIVKDFEARYQAYFNKKSTMTLISAHTYDAMNILAKAMKDTNSSDVEKVKNDIYKIKDYPGVSGLTTFDANGDVSKPFGVYKIQNGEAVLIGQ